VASTPGYGKRSQIGQLVRKLDNLNKPTPTRRPSFWKRQPLIQKIAAFLRPGLSVKNDVRRLESFLKDAEEKLGGPISTLQHPAMKDGQRLRVEKAMALLQFKRSPKDVTEAFIDATAQVEGEDPIEHRQIFVQRWRPIGAPSGKVIVMSPGFLQTGRNFYEQVQLLNAAGHEVVVMDHQWAGYTAGPRGVKKGGIDSAEGVARDFAEVAGYGNEILEKEYGSHPDKQLIAVGTSMGGGPGMTYGLKLYDAGKIKLSGGRTIPENRGFIGQGAYFGRTRSVLNDTLDFLGRIPVVRKARLWAMGAPKLTDDPFAEAKIAGHAAEEDIRGQPSAFRTPNKGLGKVIAMLKDSPPKGRGFFIHAEKDYLANPGLVKSLFGDAGDSVRVKVVPGRDHVMEETAGEQSYLLEAVRFVSGK
jgi:pimeloyl-ACP methyl ester carboxylesterase